MTEISENNEVQEKYKAEDTSSVQVSVDAVSDDVLFTLPTSDLFKNINIMRTAKNRVKIYVHSGNPNGWEDKGTGHAHCFSKDDETYIHFRHEDGDSTCHDWLVTIETNFLRQQDTLLIFTPNVHYEAALSFQTKEGADLFWLQLCELLGKVPIDHCEIGQFDLSSVPSSDDDESTSDIPSVTVATLSEIEKITHSALSSVILKERLSSIIVNNDWLTALHKVYEMCTDLDDIPSLIIIAHIVKNLLMSNNECIIAHMFEIQRLMLVFDLLSYAPNEKKPNDHVTFLYEKAVFRKVIHIQDLSTLDKIQQAYRIQYLLDVCLPPRLAAIVTPEDSWAGAIDEYLNNLRNTIVTVVLQEEAFQTELVDVLELPHIDVNHRRDLMLFLNEFVGLTEHRFVNIFLKRKIMETLFALDIFKIVKPCLIVDDYIVKKLIIEFIIQIANYDTTKLLNYILDDMKKSNGEALNIANELVKLIIYDPDPEQQLSALVSQLLKAFLSTDNQITDVPNTAEKQLFVASFFRGCFRLLFQALRDFVQDGKLITDSYQKARKASLIVNLITFCVNTHPTYSVPHIFAMYNINAIAAFLTSKHSFLILGSLTLIKTLSLLNDKHVVNNIVNSALLEKIFNIFFEKYAHVNNLYNSAYLDFFSSLLRENCDAIILQLMDKFGDQVDSLQYAHLFVSLRCYYRSIKVNSKVQRPFSPDCVKDSDLSDAEDNYPSNVVPTDSSFKPRNTIIQKEEGVFCNNAVRPPTPMRIILKTLQNCSDENDVETPSPDKLEPLKLVEYEDSDESASDNDSPSLENDTESLPIEEKPIAKTGSEQRGKKRKTSMKDEAELDSEPKRGLA